MATKLKEVDVVVVGLGWTGGILAKELAEAGLKVVALERGRMMSTAKDFGVPQVRDELRYVQRHELMGANVFPHNAAYNPTGPVGALAYWAADAIKNRYVKNPGMLV